MKKRRMSDSGIAANPSIKLFDDLATVKQAVEKIFHLYKGKETESWGTPYFAHSFAVLWTLSNYFQPLDVCLAGLFHSVLNDLPRYGYKRLAHDTNKRIAQLVKEVTEINFPGGLTGKRANWRLRKENILARFPSMSPAAKLIFTAANCDYLSSLINYYHEDGEKIWSRLNASPEEMGWYYQVFSELLTTHFQHPISKYYHDFLSKAKTVFQW